MSDPQLRVLQISASDRMGGAEAIAWALLNGLLEQGDESWMAVGSRNAANRDEIASRVIAIQNDESRHSWARLWASIARSLDSIGRVKGVKRVQLILRDWIGQPLRTFRRRRGREDFEFPGTWRLLDRISAGFGGIDLVHCHNLHSLQGYFDLRALPALCAQKPTMLTLHDAWLLSGHCAHSFECERWKTGCGQCPHLSTYPAIPRDATHYNWLRKKGIFSRSKLHVATPSRWLMEKVRQSMLAPGIVDARVIPNGVDLEVFCPGDRARARAGLGIDPEAAVLLFASAGIRDNCFKDFSTMRQALGRVGEAMGDRQLLCIALGEDAEEERIGRATIRFVGFQSEPKQVARFYRAADLYVHAAKAETFPTTILEAMACGRAVVASHVGGIPEQIDQGVTGLLANAGDSQTLAAAIAELLNDSGKRNTMACRAAAAAAARFDVRRMVRTYRNWYREILADAPSRAGGVGSSQS